MCLVKEFSLTLTFSDPWRRVISYSLYTKFEELKLRINSGEFLTFLKRFSLLLFFNLGNSVGCSFSFSDVLQLYNENFSRVSVVIKILLHQSVATTTIARYCYIV